MRMFVGAAALLLAWFPALLAAQSSTPSQPAVKESSTKQMTLVGCVTTDDQTPGRYTIADAKGGTVYRLSGTDMRTYVGQRVQITGGSPRRLRIAGGLVPSANAAAQAGAIDPPPAAASGPTTGAGLPMPEFRVKSVKTVAGGCPQQ